MSKADDNPIILGRRNCARCTRWRHATDFKWRWQKHKVGRGLIKRATKPTISSICNVCSREIERNRYNGLSKEDKHARVQRAVQANRERKQRQVEQYRRAQLAEYRANTVTNTVNGQIQDGSPVREVDIVPFRMWLIGEVRRAGTVAEVARQLDIDAEQVRRLVNGYYWNDGRYSCSPTPIIGVSTKTVDEWGILLGHPNLLNELYPWRDDG